MTRHPTFGAFCILALLIAGAFAGCGGHPHYQATEPQFGAADEASGNGNKVVILVIDGVRYTESFGDPAAAHIPRLAGALAPQGAVFDDFRNEGVTATSPGHASALTGTWQDIANDGSERPNKPTIFEYFRAHYAAPADEAWMIAGKVKLGVCSYSTHADYGSGYGAAENVGTWSDTTVVDTVLAVLHRVRPVLLVANLPSVDAAGHRGDWESYVSAIEAADSLVLEVWSALQGDPFYAGSTYLFVTDDHGRHDDDHGGFRDHGCPCEGCEHIMLVAVGPDIAAGTTVTQTYTLRDLCSTVGQILECPVPESEGVVIEEMFAGEPTGIGEKSRNR